MNYGLYSIQLYIITSINIIIRYNQYLQAQDQAKTMTQSQTYNAKINEKLRPISPFIDQIRSIFMGDDKLARLIDLNFMMENKDKQFMAKYSNYLEKINYRIYGSILVIPAALALNVFLQKKFRSSFGRSSVGGVFIDFLWLLGASWIFAILVEQNAKQKQFKNIKKQLYESKNNEYLFNISEARRNFRLSPQLFLGQVLNGKPNQMDQVQIMLRKAKQNHERLTKQKSDKKSTLV